MPSCIYTHMTNTVVFSFVQCTQFCFKIANDVHEAEVVVVEDLKDEIDEAATRVKDSLPEKVKRIRNEVVEEVTGKKLVSSSLIVDISCLVRRMSNNMQSTP